MINLPHGRRTLSKTLLSARELPLLLTAIDHVHNSRCTVPAATLSDLLMRIGRLGGDPKARAGGNSPGANAGANAGAGASVSADYLEQFLAAFLGQSLTDIRVRIVHV